MQRERSGLGADMGERGFTVSADTSTGARSVVTVLGELDIRGTPGLRSMLDALRTDGRLDVVIDMGGLEFLDAAGLGVLARANAEFTGAGGRLVLSGVRPRHHRLLVLTALDTVLTVE